MGTLSKSYTMRREQTCSGGAFVLQFTINFVICSLYWFGFRSYTHTHTKTRDHMCLACMFHHMTVSIYCQNDSSLHGFKSLGPELADLSLI